MNILFTEGILDFCEFDVEDGELVEGFAEANRQDYILLVSQGMRGALTEANRQDYVLLVSQNRQCDFC